MSQLLQNTGNIVERPRANAMPIFLRSAEAFQVRRNVCRCALLRESPRSRLVCDIDIPLTSAPSRGTEHYRHYYSRTSEGRVLDQRGGGNQEPRRSSAKGASILFPGRGSDSLPALVRSGCTRPKCCKPHFRKDGQQ